MGELWIEKMPRSENYVPIIMQSGECTSFNANLCTHYNKINKSISFEDEPNKIKGDRGGKAELLNLLSISRQPIIMTCNEPMRLWGSSNWRSNRDRVLRLSEQIAFKRVGKPHLRKIARRVMDAEGMSIDPGAMELLIDNNKGDLRSLISDLQSISIVSTGHINRGNIIDLSSIAERDIQKTDNVPVSWH